MWEQERLKIPVTLVNEYNSSMEAKARIAEIVSGQIGMTQEQRMLQEFKQRQLLLQNVDNIQEINKIEGDLR